jgi:predicted ferric reductase
MTLGVDLKFGIPICMGVFSCILVFIILKKPYLGWGNLRSCANITILIVVLGLMTAYKILDDDFKHNGMGVYIPSAVLGFLTICACINLPIIIYHIAMNLKSSRKYDPLD